MHRCFAQRDCRLVLPYCAAQSRCMTSIDRSRAILSHDTRLRTTCPPASPALPRPACSLVLKRHLQPVQSQPPDISLSTYLAIPPVREGLGFVFFLVHLCVAAAAVEY